jgi:hypothetical protein
LPRLFSVGEGDRHGIDAEFAFGGQLPQPRKRLEDGCRRDAAAATPEPSAIILSLFFSEAAPTLTSVSSLLGVGRSPRSWELPPRRAARRLSSSGFDQEGHGPKDRATAMVWHRGQHQSTMAAGM